MAAFLVFQMVERIQTEHLQKVISCKLWHGRWNECGLLFCKLEIILSRGGKRGTLRGSNKSVLIRNRSNNLPRGKLVLREIG